MGWGHLNLLASIGAGMLGISVLLFLVNVFRSRRSGQVAGDNPWGADTLEWGTSSPPPSYNFVYPPVVQGRYALWARTESTPVVTGLRTDCREVLVTNLLDAEPDHRYELPGSSVWPLALSLAVGVTFVGVIFTPWAVPVGAVLTFLALLGWFWPNSEPRQVEEKQRLPLVEKPRLSLEQQP
jgi:cytochrome c oxidase subunit I+III